MICCVCTCACCRFIDDARVIAHAMNSYAGRFTSSSEEMSLGSSFNGSSGAQMLCFQSLISPHLFFSDSELDRKNLVEEGEEVQDHNDGTASPSAFR